MSCEVPSHIDILLKETEVEASRIDVTNVANVPRLNDIDDLADHRRVKKRMPHHQDDALPGSQVDQFLTFGGTRRHRLFDKCVLSGEQLALANGKWCLTEVAITVASSSIPLSKCSKFVSA